MAELSSRGKGTKLAWIVSCRRSFSPHEGPECQHHSLLSQLSLSFTGQIFHMYLVHALRRIWKPSNKLWCAELLPEELSRCHPSDGRVSLHGKLCLSCLWFELFQIQTKLPQLFFKIVLKMQYLEASIKAKAYMGFLLWVEILRKSCPVYPKSTSTSIPRLSLDSSGLVCLPQDWWWLFVFLRHRYVTQQIPVLGLSLPSHVFSYAQGSLWGNAAKWYYLPWAGCCRLNKIILYIAQHRAHRDQVLPHQGWVN